MLKAAIRYVKYAYAAPVLDAVLSVFPQLSRGEAPPDIINFAGGGDFLVVGDATVESLVDLTDLKAGQTIVDIGCGIGRNATALYRRFGSRIHYLGFDAVRYGITWCRKHVSSRSGNYVFIHSDIYNSFYNPRGRLSPERYVFPCESGFADVIFAVSVFTHMQSRMQGIIFARRRA